jgi:hypothetical protein
VGVAILGALAALFVYAGVEQMGSRSVALLAAIVVGVVLVVYCCEDEG